MNWDKARVFLSEALSGPVEKELAKEGIPYTVRVNVSSKKVTLTSGNAELVVYSNGFIFIPKFPKEIPCDLNKDANDAISQAIMYRVYSSSHMPVQEIVSFLRAYGENAVPWEEKTEQELRSYLLALPNLSFTTFESLQELKRRV